MQQELCVYIIVSICHNDIFKQSYNSYSNLQQLEVTPICDLQVSEDNVYTCVGHPLRSDITNIINWMLNEDFQLAYKSILLTVITWCKFTNFFPMMLGSWLQATESCLYNLN